MSRSARRLAVFGLAGTLLAVAVFIHRTELVPRSNSGDAALREALPVDADSDEALLVAPPRHVEPRAPAAAAPTPIDGDSRWMIVRGRVLDDEGRPVVGAMVEGVHGVLGADGNIVHPPPVSTGPDGSFVVRNEPDDLAEVTISHAQYRPWYGRWSARDEAVIRLEREDRPYVHLRFRGDVPPDGTICVALAAGDGDVSLVDEHPIRCEVRGGVAVLPERLEPDTWRVLVRSDTGAAGLAMLRVPSGPDVVEMPFDLRPPRRLTVRVVDARGAPAGDVLVNARNCMRRPSSREWKTLFNALAKTDVITGIASLEVPEVPAIYVGLPGLRGTSHAVPDGAAEVRLVVPPDLSLSGRVIGLVPPDPEDTRGCLAWKGLSCDWNPPEKEPPRIECVEHGEGLDRLGWTQAADDGRFTLYPRGGAWPEGVMLRAIVGLRRGPWTSVVLREGIPPTDVVVVAPSEGGSIEGTVRDPGGQPVAGASVGFAAGVSPLEYFEILAQSDERGCFVARGVPPGEWAVRADAAGVRSAVGRARTGGDPVVLVVPRPGKVVGRIMSRWRPSYPLFAYVALVEGDGSPHPARYVVGSPSDDFTIEGVRPGRARVFVRTPREAGISAAFDLESGGTADAGVIALVPGAVIEGRLVTPVGTSNANLPVVVWDPRVGNRLTVCTDLAGRFRAQGLWAGTWSVGPAPLDAPEDGTSVTVEMGHTHEVTVTVP
jgi:hypothetical protein